MSMKYIRDYYGVPAKRGARVRYTGHSSGDVFEGAITSSLNARIWVRFDGDPFGSRPTLLHPTWEVEYLETETAQ